MGDENKVKRVPVTEVAKRVNSLLTKFINEENSIKKQEYLNKAYEEFLPYIFHLVNIFRNKYRGVSQDAIRSAADMSFVKAANAFDPNKYASFSTLYRVVFDRDIYYNLNNEIEQLGYTPNRHNMRLRTLKIMKQFKEENGREMEPEEYKQYIHMDELTYNTLFNKHKIVSTFTKVNEDDENELESAEVKEDDFSEEIINAMGKEAVAKRVFELMKQYCTRRSKTVEETARSWLTVFDIMAKENRLGKEKDMSPMNRSKYYIIEAQLKIILEKYGYDTEKMSESEIQPARTTLLHHIKSMKDAGAFPLYKEEYILMLMTGYKDLPSKEKTTLDSVGKMLGLTRERVRQVYFKSQNYLIEKMKTDKRLREGYYGE